MPEGLVTTANIYVYYDSNDSSLINKSLSTMLYNSTSQNLTQTNNCDGPADYKDFYEKAQHITGLFVYPILCLIGILGNILSLCVFWHKDMRACSTNAFLSSIALSDLIKLLNDFLYFIIVLVRNVDKQQGQWLMSLVYPFTHYLFNMTVLVTSWLTVSVAVERYIYVCHPAKARQLCTVWRARFVCSQVALVMMILAVPSALRYEARTDVDVNDSCASNIVLTEFGKDKTYMLPWSWTQNLLRGFIPVILLIFLNYRIIKELWKRRVTGRWFEARHRIAVMLILLIFMFLACITPDAVMSTVFNKGYIDEDYKTKGVREITDTLLAVNSAFNICFYLTMSEKFRETFKLQFCRRQKSASHRTCKKDTHQPRELVPLVLTGNGRTSSTTISSNKSMSCENSRCQDVLISTDLSLKKFDMNSVKL